MRRWLKELSKTLADGHLVEIDRTPEIKDKDRGYVIGANEAFLMLNYLCMDMVLNGYSVFPTEDITAYRVYDDDDGFASKALRARKQSPRTQPRIELTDFPSLFESANRVFPLITIHRERMDDSVCFIGRVEKLTDRTVTLKEIDPAAKWERTRRYRFADITRIDFGGPYESALWLVHCEESGDKKLLARARAADRPFARKSH